MTEQERFQLVLEELRALLSRLGDLAGNVVLVGGQVNALEALASGEDGRVRVETSTGIVLDRGFTFESDLLIDHAAVERYGDELPHALRELGFRRTGRSYRWAKSVQGVDVEIDLFAPPGTDAAELSTPMTELPGGDIALARATRIQVAVGGRQLEVGIPDPVGFLMMKVISKKELRPRETKDCFDMFVYLQHHDPAEIAQALAEFGGTGPLLDDLEMLFGDVDAPGVRDVLAYPALADDIAGQLLARSVVDRFGELLRAARGT